MTERSLFADALEQPTAERRAAYLDTACGADPDLRARIEALLESYGRPANPLDRSAPERLADDLLHSDDGAETSADAWVAGPDECMDFLEPSDDPGALGRIGHYEVLEVIGRGGMGVVVRARDAKLQRQVAIKVMAPALAANVTARMRFTREAQAAAAVRSDHVVAIHAVEEARGLPYLVMECISGQSLQNRLDGGEPLGLAEVLRIGAQAAAGLAAAHAQGLIHRDIKPANILLENDAGRVKITDFGLARAVDDESLTQTGLAPGTPQYMAPEQAAGEGVDHRADLFSMGSVLYAMCTGRPPFQGRGALAVLKRVCEDQPTPIRTLNPAIPEWLEAIVGKLHAKNPAERFESATEVERLLAAHLAHLEQPSRVPPPAGPPPRRRTAHRRWRVAAAVLALAATVGVTEATGVTGLASTVIRILTPDGTLVVEVDDPAIKVTVEGDGGLVITGAGPHEVRLRPGSYHIEATKDGHPVRRELVTITRGDRRVIRVAMESSTTRLAAAVDLLKLVNPVRDAVQGQWRFEKNSLVSPATGQWDRLIIPFLPPDEYDLEITAQRKQGKDSLTVALVSGLHEFFVGLDMSEGRVAGLGQIDGKEALANETARQHPVFGDGLPHKIVCRVRRTGVSVTIDTKSLIDWRGQLDRLSRPKGGETGRLGLCVSNSSYSIHDMVLRPVQQARGDDPKAATPFVFTPPPPGPFDQLDPAKIPAEERFAWQPKELVAALGESRGRMWTSPRGAALSPNGMLAATCGVTQDTFIYIWDVATMRLKMMLAGHSAPAWALAFSSDGRRLLSGGEDSTLRLWDLETGRELKRLDGHTGTVTGVAFSPTDARIALSGATDQTMRLWDLETGKELGRFDGHAGALTSVAFSPDGTHALSACMDMIGRLWHVGTRKVVTRFAGHSMAFRITFVDNDRALSAGHVSPLRLWDLQTGKELRSFVGHTGGVFFATASTDGRRVLSGSNDGTIRLWDLQTAAELKRIQTPSQVNNGALFPDGQRALCTHWDGTVRLWDLETGKEVFPQVGIGPLCYYPSADHWHSRLVFSPDGRQVLAGMAHPVARVWDVENGKQLPGIEVSSPIWGVAWCPDGRVVCAGTDGIALFDGKSRKELHRFQGASGIGEIALSRDGRRLVSAGEVGLVQVWDVTTGKELYRFEGLPQPVRCVAISPDGRRALSGNSDGTVRLYDLDEGHELDCLRVHGSIVWSVAFSPDGVRAASGDTNGTIRLWDLTGPKPKSRPLPGRHARTVESLSFAPDGKSLASSGYFGEVAIWDLASGDKVREWQLPGSAQCVAYTPDGRHLATANVNGTVYILRLSRP